MLAFSCSNGGIIKYHDMAEELKGRRPVHGVILCWLDSQLSRRDHAAIMLDDEIAAIMLAKHIFAVLIHILPVPSEQQQLQDAHLAKSCWLAAVLRHHAAVGTCAVCWRMWAATDCTSVWPA